MYENYVAEIKKEPPKEAPSLLMNYNADALTNPAVIVSALECIEYTDVAYLYEILSRGYATILSSSFISENKVTVANAFMNSKFVTAFSQVLQNVKVPFTIGQKICCNKLIYDYLTLPKEKDKHIEGLLYNLGLSINRETIPGLLGLGLDQTIVSQLVIARFSTSKEILAVKRINVIIVNSPLEIMTEQMIVNIYEKLFDHAMPLFEGIMFDCWDDELFKDEPEQEEIYGLINLALLDIINEMTSDKIAQILTQYVKLKEMQYNTTQIRFNIHAISSDYQRIIDVIDGLEKFEGVVIPSY